MTLGLVAPQLKLIFITRLSLLHLLFLFFHSRSQMMFFDPFTFFSDLTRVMKVYERCHALIKVFFFYYCK